ncbi:hypothetical protein [Methanobacterium paludis]|uniref:DUF4268 domain-containing protein n=1 Tax=Methanobacterium paludis (strain DSM 25820 / JCM 18151 / SWAN1) TaxID=868131 RepID=F6D4U7_METPW|nr:hypothetical protein [Methanobacterium paludis]AEG18156.1 hypothetical protein MSWAN_1138 [Methanobacterium paludis]
MLKYLGLLKEPNGKKTSTTTTFEVTFVENKVIAETEFAELTKFMGEYYGIPRPQTSITWRLTYNSDSTVLIRLKFEYLDIGWPNENIRQDRYNEILVSEFEIVYKKFLEPKLFKPVPKFSGLEK